MNIALLLARVGLSVVFLIAGVTKLADLKGSRQALRDFGTPAWFADPAGLLLPLAELAVAGALLPLTSAWWAAIGALILLLAFMAGIAYNLARGRQPDCHCFGQVYSKPIGRSTLLRNLVLAAVAVFLVGFGRTTPGLSAFTWLAALSLTERLALGAGLFLLALLGGAGWLLVQMLRQQGRLLLRLEALEERMAAAGTAGSITPAQATPPAGLPVGSLAPDFALPGLYGETLTLDFLRAGGKPVLLLFSDPGCGPCNSLLPEVGRWQRDYAGKLTVALISRGNVEANRAKASEHGIGQVLLQHEREIAESYQGRGTPGAVLVRPDGTIGSPLAQGAEAIRALVASAVGLPVLHAVPAPLNGHGNGHGNGALPLVKPETLANASKIGTPAPAFSLPDLSGQTVALSDFRDHTTLLVVSTGSAETNRALGLRSTIVLDQNMSVGSTFGANGTPMGVLVDAQGKLASALAAGAPAVLALAGVDQEQPDMISR